MVAPSRRGRHVPEETPEEGGVGRFIQEHRAGLLATAVVAASVIAGWLVWSRVSGRASVQPDAVLLPEAVTLEGVAPWVRSDVKAEALRNASLDGGLPLGDPELPRRLARAFDMHPWVRQVERVSLAHPAAATVTIACREPVAMVGVQGGLLAIDAEGVVLPSADFTAEAAATYPRISGIESSPQGPEGSAWGDPAVEEAAALAVAIGPEWQSLGLVECRAVGKGTLRRWELVGPESRRIVFGAAPGREVSGEPGAAAKVARLRAFATDPAGAVAEQLDLTQAAEGDAAGRSIPSIPAP
jgi:hypothetical protein